MKKNVFWRSAAVSLSALLLAGMAPAIPADAEETKYIALTFDDGPNTSTTSEVLDLLEQYNAKATFFLVGNNINEESAKSVKRAHDLGCEIDNHSKSHDYMTNLSADEIKAEIKYVDDYVYEITGEYPSFFRPPYIAVNAEMYSAIDVPFICGAGCEDWDTGVTAEQRAQKVLSQAQDGQIILMHDAQGNDQTVEALKTIIPTLQKEGYTLVTLNELFKAQNVTPDQDSMYSVVTRTGAAAAATDPTAEKTTEPTAEKATEPTTAGKSGITIPDLHIEQKSAPDNEGIRFVKDMRLGWNLGNTLDAYDDQGIFTNELDIETYWNGGFKTTQEMIDTVKAAGFNTIRIPVSWHNHVDADFNISKAWMDRVQETVDYAVADDLYVILNVHHDNSENTMYPDSAHYEASSKYMTSIWKQVAERFQNYDDKLIFETMNEPRLVGHTNEWWLNMENEDCIDAIKTINKLNQDCVDVIRAGGGKNATRYIAVPGYDCSYEGATNEYFELPKDSAEGRMIVAVHAYLPYGFALAEETDPQSTDKFSIDKDTKDLEKALDAAYDKYVANGIPVYIGEFAALEKQKNLQARVDWSAYYAAYATSRNITCCWWDAPGGMMLLDRSNCTWKDPMIVKALNQYTGGSTEIVFPTAPVVQEGETVKGKVTYDSSNKIYQISLPEASGKIYLNVTLSEEAKGGASGCIANGFMKDGTYYWAMVPWKASKSGEVVIDIDKDFGTLAYGDDQTSDDPELIAYAKDYLKTLKSFQAQVWWVGDSSYKGIDNSNAEITEAYIKQAAAPAETVTCGDVNLDGTIDILDVVALNKHLLGVNALASEKQKAADTDANGKLDSTDSLKLLKYVLEMIDKLPA